VRFRTLALTAALYGAMLAGQTATPRSSKKAAGSKSKKKTAVVRRAAQQQPTVERYKEIQQALADKGYFRGPVDGVWGADSVEALKRFQREQNIEDDGKIGSLSLIALGLGPPHSAASANPAPGSSQPAP